ncbi:hypothetical protein FZW96_17650 [Bacillus sp. BGMRC 2118]|nr:hypothetical protein FZW96_17650 [Bacillus sp. BGMRC 2118]
MFPGAFIFDEVNSSTDTKLNHDRYDVYVNGEFVGHKTLLTQSETIGDVNDFLQTQGYQKFEAKLDGDHYDVQVDEDEAAVKEALQIYLQSR